MKTIRINFYIGKSQKNRYNPKRFPKIPKIAFLIENLTRDPKTPLLGA